MVGSLFFRGPHLDLSSADRLPGDQSFHHWETTPFPHTVVFWFWVKAEAKTAQSHLRAPAPWKSWWSRSRWWSPGTGRCSCAWGVCAGRSPREAAASIWKFHKTLEKLKNLFLFKEENISNNQHDDNEDAKREQPLNNHKEIIHKLLMGKCEKTKNNPINCCWSTFSLTFCNWWIFSCVLFICGSFSSSSCQTSALSNTKERLITW